MKVDFIHPPFVYTNDGKRLTISDFEKQPIKGSSIALNPKSKKYITVSSAEDNLCGNGSCPVK